MLTSGIAMLLQLATATIIALPLGGQRSLYERCHIRCHMLDAMLLNALITFWVCILSYGCYGDIVFGNWCY